MTLIEQRVVIGLTAIALSWVCAGGAHAQSLRPYVGGAVGSFNVDADDVDGRSAATGLVAGLTVSRLVDVEGEILFPSSTFVRSTTAVSTSLAPPNAPLEEIKRLGVTSLYERERDVTANFSFVAIIHPAATGRVVPGLVAGVTLQRAKNVFRLTTVSIPPGVDPQHPGIISGEERSTRTISAPTIGGQVSVRVTPHFFVVPDLRYDYGSIGDEINNTLRMSVRGIWRF